MRAARPIRAAGVAAIGLAACAAGCADAGPAAAPRGAPGEAPALPAIYGGAAVAEGAFEAVVALVDDGALCSGTLVAPRVILTAAHCVADLDDGELPEVHLGPLVTQGQTLQAERVGVHPDFCRACDEGLNDFGFVVLAEDHAPIGGFPAPIADQATWDEVMREGAPLTLVGFGQSDDAPDDPFLGAGVEREVGAAIAEIRDTGLEFVAGGDGAGTCAGDSGGPALAAADGGGLRLAGVLARGECGGQSLYGAPYAALCWLRDEAGADLVPAGCEACDCLDTEPSGCACRAAAAPGGGAGGLALACAGALLAIGRARGRGARRRR